MRRGWQRLLLYDPYLDLCLQFGVNGVLLSGANRALENDFLLKGASLGFQLSALIFTFVFRTWTEKY